MMMMINISTIFYITSWKYVKLICFLKKSNVTYLFTIDCYGIKLKLFSCDSSAVGELIADIFGSSDEEEEFEVIASNKSKFRLHFRSILYIMYISGSLYFFSCHLHHWTYWIIDQTLITSFNVTVIWFYLNWKFQNFVHYNAIRL